MSNGFYTEETIEHFRHPHNFGEIKNPDAYGEAGNIICGDIMSLYLKIRKSKDKEIIADIKFRTYGCAAAIATSSVVTDLVKGKTIDEALKIDKDNVVKTLKGLPPIKIHCSVLAIDALSEALYQYLKKHKREVPPDLKKRHDHVEKEKKSIDERYHHWQLRK